jgi:hypothetical protein
MERSKTKRATSFRDAARHVWKRRSFPFKRKTQRGDLHTSPSAGNQPVAGDDAAASQGQQSNDVQSPQATQSSGLFPFPNLRLGEAVGIYVEAMPKPKAANAKERPFCYRVIFAPTIRAKIAFNDLTRCRRVE